MKTLIYGVTFNLILITSLVSQIQQNLHFSGQWFVAYENDNYAGEETNQFILKRGYVTVRNKFNQNFSARVTQDIAVDQEGDGQGDIEIRLKYGYLRYLHDDISIFTKPFIEFGLVHRPWLDFEQSINRYRVQGTMFAERYGLLRSADYGITFSALLGNELDDEFKSKINKKYAGKYGSISFGIYNGGGYEEIERNKNKLVESRFSVRPVPDKIPGFQISYGLAFGEGNSVEAPEFLLNSLFLSYETEYLISTLYIYDGTGSLQGTAIDTINGNSISQNGLSLFCDISLFNSPYNLILRYDQFDNELNKKDMVYLRYISGLSYNFLDNCKLLLDYDYLKQNYPTSSTFKSIEIAVEFKY